MAEAGDRRFRVLSLDGGGIKGAFTAAALAALEERTGKRSVDHFDLIVGTSTGGILALGIGLGFSAKELLDFYVERGPAIFPSTGLKRRLGGLRQIFRPKHSHEVLRKALVEKLGDRLLGESQCRLGIPTYDAISGRIYVMKTPHYEGAVADAHAPAVDVALATAAAPTYFQAAEFPIRPGASYVDGGVWANCPALVGVTEAIAFLGQRREDIDLLSIGTTSQPFSIQRQRTAGAARWNVGLIGLMFEAQVEAARAHAALLAGSFHRIDAIVPPGEYTLDRADPDTIGRLADRGRTEATKRATLDIVKARFLNGMTASPYQRFP